MFLTANQIFVWQAMSSTRPAGDGWAEWEVDRSKRMTLRSYIDDLKKKPKFHRSNCLKTHARRVRVVPSIHLNQAHVAQISANFVASDGGKGKLDLSPSGG